MFPLEPYDQIKLRQQVANYNRTSPYERKIADVLMEADFAARGEGVVTPRAQQTSRFWFGMRAIFGRLTRRAPAHA